MLCEYNDVVPDHAIECVKMQCRWLAVAAKVDKSRKKRSQYYLLDIYRKIFVAKALYVIILQIIKAISSYTEVIESISSPRT